jgi:hypothetical protein
MPLKPRRNWPDGSKLSRKKIDGWRRLSISPNKTGRLDVLPIDSKDGVVEALDGIY